MLSLDTHILVLATTGRLSRDERRVMDDDFWGISDIVLWEVGQLERSGRLAPIIDQPAFRLLLDRLTVWPITLEIVQAARGLDFRSDPADEIIAATSLVQDVALVTRDMRILRSRVVPLALR